MCQISGKDVNEIEDPIAMFFLTEVGEKSPSAVDYSDINEVVEDDALARHDDEGEC